MEVKEIKRETRQVLKGRWKAAIGLSALYGIIILLINSIAGIGTIAFIVFSIPSYVGMMEEFNLFLNSQNVKATDFLEKGFKYFFKAWAIFFLILVRVILKFILIMFASMELTLIVSSVLYGILGIDINSERLFYLAIILTFIVSYFSYSKYALAKYIYINNPEKSIKEILNESKMLMKGNRKKYLLLQLSFLGWYIPAIIIFVISIIMMMQIFTFIFSMFVEVPSSGYFLEVVMSVLLGGSLISIDYIYVSFIFTYKNIANIKFFEKLNNK